MSDTPEARPGAPRPPAAASAPRPPAPSAARIAPRVPPKGPAAPSTPRALPEDDDDDASDDVHLRSSAIIPAAEELKLIPPAPPTPVVPPPVPRAQSSAELLPRTRPHMATIAGVAPPSSPDLGEQPRPPSMLDMDLPKPPPRASSPDHDQSVTPRVPVAAAKPRPASSPDLGSTTAVMPVVAAPPAAAPAVITQEAQAQLFDVLRAVLDATLAPLLAKQQDLEVRLEALQRAARQPASSPLSAVPAVRAMAPSLDITASLSPAPAPRASVVMTSYGPVSVMPTPAPRPAIEAALENVGSFDMPDFAGKRKFAGRIIIGILILGVIAAIVATVLSYS